MEDVETGSGWVDAICPDCGKPFRRNGKRYTVGFEKKRRICGKCFLKPRNSLGLGLVQMRRLLR